MNEKHSSKSRPPTAHKSNVPSKSKSKSPSSGSNEPTKKSSLFSKRHKSTEPYHYYNSNHPLHPHHHHKSTGAANESRNRARSLDESKKSTSGSNPSVSLTPNGKPVSGSKSGRRSSSSHNNNHQSGQHKKKMLNEKKSHGKHVKRTSTESSSIDT